MTSSPYPEEAPHCEQQPVVRDKRRIDPATGRLRTPAAPPAADQQQQDQAATPSDPPPYESLFGGMTGNGGNAATSAQPAAAGSATPEAVAAENHSARTAYVAAATKAYADSQKSGTAAAQPGSCATAASQEQQTATTTAGGAHPNGSSAATSSQTSPTEPAASASASEESAPASGEADPDLAAQLADRTADLQRLSAEYANYRRRVERERETIRTQAVAQVATSLLPLLDDIDRAREHGDLNGGFKSVGEALEQAMTKLGVAKFGQPGDVFDPNIHEAMMHTHSDEVTETTAVQVFQAGYTLGDKLLRPARVAAADPS